MVEKTIEEILEKYFDNNEEYYFRYRDDGDDGNIDIKDELTNALTSLGVNYKLEIVEAFDSCAYECYVLSIAYIEPNNNWGSLELKNVLLEVM